MCVCVRVSWWCRYNATRAGADIGAADRLIVTGASAGGFMTFYHCDRIRSMVRWGHALHVHVHPPMPCTCDPRPCRAHAFAMRVGTRPCPAPALPVDACTQPTKVEMVDQPLGWHAIDAPRIRACRAPCPVPAGGGLASVLLYGAGSQLLCARWLTRVCRECCGYVCVCACCPHTAAAGPRAHPDALCARLRVLARTTLRNGQADVVLQHGQCPAPPPPPPAPHAANAAAAAPNPAAAPAPLACTRSPKTRSKPPR